MKRARSSQLLNACTRAWGLASAKSLAAASRRPSIPRLERAARWRDHRSFALQLRRGPWRGRERRSRRPSSRARPESRPPSGRPRIIKFESAGIDARRALPAVTQRRGGVHRECVSKCRSLPRPERAGLLARGYGRTTRKESPDRERAGICVSARIVLPNYRRIPSDGPAAWAGAPFKGKTSNSEEALRLKKSSTTSISFQCVSAFLRATLQFKHRRRSYSIFFLKRNEPLMNLRAPGTL